MELDQPELEGQLLLNGARNCDNRAAVASLSLETTSTVHKCGPTAVYNHEETWGSHTPRHHGFFRAVETVIHSI